MDTAHLNICVLCGEADGFIGNAHGLICKPCLTNAAQHFDKPVPQGPDSVRCHFCNATFVGRGHVVAGAGGDLCATCTEEFVDEWLALTGQWRTRDPKPNACLFCGKRDTAVLEMVATADARICDECIELCVEVLIELDGENEPEAVPEPAERHAEPSEQSLPEPPAEHDLLSCSFCHRSQREVAKLIAGPSVFICNLCVGVGSEIVQELSEGASLAMSDVEVRMRRPDPE